MSFRPTSCIRVNTIRGTRRRKTASAASARKRGVKSSELYELLMEKPIRIIIKKGDHDQPAMAIFLSVCALPVERSHPGCTLPRTRVSSARPAQQQTPRSSRCRLQQHCNQKNIEEKLRKMETTRSEKFVSVWRYVCVCVVSVSVCVRERVCVCVCVCV